VAATWRVEAFGTGAGSGVKIAVLAPILSFIGEVFWLSAPC